METEYWCSANIPEFTRSRGRWNDLSNGVCSIALVRNVSAGHSQL